MASSSTYAFSLIANKIALLFPLHAASTFDQPFVKSAYKEFSLESIIRERRSQLPTIICI